MIDKDPQSVSLVLILFLHPIKSFFYTLPNLGILNLLALVTVALSVSQQTSTSTKPVPTKSTTASKTVTFVSLPASTSCAACASNNLVGEIVENQINSN